MNATLQEHKCNMNVNSMFANSTLMSESVNDQELVRALVKHTKIAATPMAKAIGVTTTTLTRQQSGEATTKLSLRVIRKLQQEYPDFPGFHLSGDQPVASPGRSYLPVNILPSYAGMGGGGSGEGEPETGLVSRSLIEDVLKAKTEDLLLIDVRGDSMEPDFEHGDQILIDQRDKNPIQPGSFALWDGDGYVVKLVERVPQKSGYYRVFSSNTRYSAYEVNEEEIKIMGRPVWFARRL